MDTYMPMDTDDEILLEDRLVLERYCNGDWEPEREEYEVYVADIAMVDVLAPQVETVEKVPNAICRSLAVDVMSRWKGGFTNALACTRV